MTNREFIEKLSEFDPDLEVKIVDGFKTLFYSTNRIGFSVFEEDDGTEVLDIEIGGCDE